MFLLGVAFNCALSPFLRYAGPDFERSISLSPHHHYSTFLDTMALSTTDGILAQFHSIFQSNARRTHKCSISNSSFVPHLIRHGIASIDPRFEQNRSFHQLSGHLKSMRIEHEALGQQTKGLALSTYKWGQDQLAEHREDSAGDEALADITDRLAYVISLIGDLHVDHAKNIEDSRADLKRIQKLELELTPRRQQRIKIHKELMNLIPERAIPNSEKVKSLEDQLHILETEDQAQEQELGKLKRGACKSSFDMHFDSMIELSEKMALVAKYGKLALQQLPIYSPPFPTPRSHSRLPGEPSWQNETQLAAIRAAVEPALREHKTDYSLPFMPILKDASTLSQRETVSFAESNKKELAEMLAEGNDVPTLEAANKNLGPHDSAISQSIYSRQSFSSNTGPLSPLPEGGSLPPNLNLEPTVLPPPNPRRTSSTSRLDNEANTSPIPVSDSTPPPRSVFDEPGSSAAFMKQSGPPDMNDNVHSATIADQGPTFAETGSPIATLDPGPITGVLSPRRKSQPSERKPMPPLPADIAAATSANAAAKAMAAGQSNPGSALSTSSPPPHPTAKQEKEALEQAEVQKIADEVRGDGESKKKDEEEELPSYQE